MSIFTLNYSCSFLPCINMENAFPSTFKVRKADGSLVSILNEMKHNSPVELDYASTDNQQSQASPIYKELRDSMFWSDDDDDYPHKPNPSQSSRVCISSGYENTHSHEIQNIASSSKNKQKQPKRYLCTFQNCNKTFTTAGHLARHKRIHTGEKNFKCIHPGCNSKFSRQDNMMQHYRTHTSSKSQKKTKFFKRLVFLEPEKNKNPKQ